MRSVEDIIKGSDPCPYTIVTKKPTAMHRDWFAGYKPQVTVPMWAATSAKVQKKTKY